MFQVYNCSETHHPMTQQSQKELCSRFGESLRSAQYCIQNGDAFGCGLHLVVAIELASAIEDQNIGRPAFHFAMECFDLAGRLFHVMHSFRVIRINLMEGSEPN